MINDAFTLGYLYTQPVVCTRFPTSTTKTPRRFYELSFAPASTFPDEDADPGEDSSSSGSGAEEEPPPPKSQEDQELSSEERRAADEEHDPNAGDVLAEMETATPVAGGTSRHQALTGIETATPVVDGTPRHATQDEEGVGGCGEMSRPQRAWAFPPPPECLRRWGSLVARCPAPQQAWPSPSPPEHLPR